MMWPQKVGCVILSYSSNGTTSPAMTCTQRTFTPVIRAVRSIVSSVKTDLRSV